MRWPNPHWRNDGKPDGPIAGSIFHTLIAVLCGMVMPWASCGYAAQPPQQGLAAHYYGQQAFARYAGQTRIKALWGKLDLNGLKWPLEKQSEGKIVFSRYGGWSVAVYGWMEIDTEGEYCFKHARNEDQWAELWLGQKLVPTDGEKEIFLRAGRTPLRLYAKSAYLPSNWKVNMDFQWRQPGVEIYEEIDPQLLSYDESDAARTNVFNPDIELENGGTPFVGIREYEIYIPEDGFYEFSGHFRQRLDFDLFLDGRFLNHSNNKGHGGRWTFINTARTVRRVKKGPHKIRLSGFTRFSHEPIDEFLHEARFGVSRVPGNDPAGTLSITEQGREDMVFRKGEPLTILIEQTTREAASYTMEVVRQRQEEVIWTGETDLPANTEHARAEISYPCDEEGAFEYRVRDGEREPIEGPWAFVVIDPTPVKPAQADGKEAAFRKTLIDTIDCSLEDDPVHKFRHNGTSKVVSGPAGPYRVTGNNRYPLRRYVKEKDKWRPALEGEKSRHFYAFDWFAYTLRVEHPGKCHVVTAHIPTDALRLVMAQAHDHVTGNYNGGVLFTDNNPESPKLAVLSFPVWPNTNALDVSSWCVGASGHEEPWPGAIAKIELFELPDGLPMLAEAAGGWSAAREFGWRGEQIDIGLDQNTMPPLWDDGELIPGDVAESLYYDWKALWTAWERYGQFAGWRGDNLLIWPAYVYGWTTIPPTDHMERCRQAYGEGYKFRAVDRMWRDVFKMQLLICQKYGVKLVADFMFQMLRPEHILATDKDGKHTEDGIFLSDLGQSQQKVLNPAHPLSRKYMVDFVGEIARKYGAYPSFGGINLRMWINYGNMPGIFGGTSRGYDDFTTSAFERETGEKMPVERNDPDRRRKRREYLLRHAEDKWLDWQSEKAVSLRKEMLAELKKHAPQAKIYAHLGAPIGRDEGLDATKILGDRDLEYSAGLMEKQFGEPYHIECSWLDPIELEKFDIRQPEYLRRTLENMTRGNLPYPKPMCAGSGAPIRPHPYQLEGPGKALAEGELHTVVYGGQWLLPAMDEGLRQWVRTWRAIPALTYKRFGQESEPVACWYGKTEEKLAFYLVNRTPFSKAVEIALEGADMAVRDLVTGKELPRREKGGNARNSSKQAIFSMTIAPYMLAVLSAQKASAIISVVLANEEIRVGAFCIDKYEVTNAEYERFDASHRALRDKRSAGDNDPAVYVAWRDAIRFCNWRSRQAGLEPCYDEETGACDRSKNGYRLPDESEWEKAARGDDGRAYPWGNDAPSEGTLHRCNYGCYDIAGRNDPEYKRRDGHAFAAPVGSYPGFNSPYGLCDMAGNVWEWCQDAYDPSSGDDGVRALRGGSWASDAHKLRSTYRTGAYRNARSETVGFRCVRNVAQP